jgi:hypothetical protein
MKSSIRGLLMGALGAAALGLSPLAASPARAIESGEITLGQERVQVVHSGDDSDTANLNFSFTNYGNGYGGCDYGGYDAIASGVEVSLLGKSCGDYFYECYYYDYCPPTSSFPFDYIIYPFVAHTINTQSYGTFFGQYPVDDGPGTVSARIVSTPKPSDACGTWTLNLEATGLDLYKIQSNPISLWLNDAADSGPFCFDIYNAVIGNPIAPPTPVVRKGVRR